MYGAGERSAIAVALNRKAAALTAATTAVTVPEPTTIATLAAVAFAGGAAFGLAGEYMNHRADDPAPVFNGPTTLLFDTAGMVLSFLLFVVPALRLDLALRPDDPLPGLFGFMALFLSVFLVTILRGLLCNLGLAREEEDERPSV